ncbi:MAG: EpsG family protein [Clostridiales bacterium]|nr:EpsG family protein [Clostridiales bacterium]
MTIYIITIILIVILQPVLQLVLGSDKYKNTYNVLIGTWLFLVLALRSESVGSDLPTYIRRYAIFGNTEWNNLAEVAEINDTEIGYAALNKILYMLSDNPRLLICVVSFFLIYVFSREIKLNSDNPAFSYFLYITLGMYVRTFNTIRQQIAAAIALLAYHYIKEKKPIKFLVVILAASTIHKSVLIVIPMYFIARMKINYKVYICSFMGCILSIVIGDRLLSLITYKERYTATVSSVSNGAIGSCIIFGAFIILMIIICKKFKASESRFYMHFSIFCLLISSFTFVMPIIARVLFYFDAVTLLAVPNTVGQVKNISTRYFIICGVCAVTLFYYICIICRADVAAVIPYSFYRN